MKRINAEELHGLLLLNGYEPSESNRMYDSNPLLQFYKELDSPFRGLTSSSLYFTKSNLKFIEAEYDFDFRSDIGSPLRAIMDKLSCYDFYTIVRRLKECPFKFNCVDHFDHAYSLIYRPYYFSKILNYSYCLENKNIYLGPYETENTFSNIPIFLNGEECARYIHSLI